MRPLTKTLLAGVATAGLMGGTALAQQIILVPQPGGQTAQGGAQAGAQDEQRFILVPAPRFAPDAEAQGRPDSATAVELYRRGYQQGIADAERAGVARQQIDPAAIERIGRELFERGYVLGMMQGQMQAAQAGQQQAAQQQPGQQQAQAGQQPPAEAEAGQQQAQAGQQLVETPQLGTADFPTATIRADSSEQYGQYLTDNNGRAVYMFTADEQGQGDQTAVSNCYDDCAAAWPPVLTQGTPAEAAGPVQADLLSTIERQDGTMQVTYNGWPLYYYVEDEGQAEATGQDVHGFGGEWYLLTPEGEKVGEG